MLLWKALITCHYVPSFTVFFFFFFLSLCSYRRIRKHAQLCLVRADANPHR